MPYRLFTATLLAHALLLAALATANAQFDVHIYDTDGIPPSVHRQRRERVLQALSPRTVMVLPSADVRNRQNDVDYEYRQNSNLLYLSGFPHAGGALLLSKNGITLNGVLRHEVLFVRERKRDREVWTGVEMGPREAQDLLAVDTALPASDLLSVLETSLANVDTLIIPTLPTRVIPLPLVGINLYVGDVLKEKLLEKFPKLTVKYDPSILAAMREVKDDHEIRLLQRAIDVSIEGHLAAMAVTKPGIHEYQIEAAMEYTFRDRGAEDVGYPSIVGSSYNACILHYTSNRKQTAAGELVLADCGAEYRGYTADITRTWPVSGRFTEDQRAIYNIVLEAQDSGIAACTPGAAFWAPHLAALEVIKKRLMELGIISSPTEAQRYFMHGTSHYLGLDVHDLGTRGPLKPGTVLTVEPGIYIPSGSPCDQRWWNIGVRIEDDIMVTPSGPINMSGKLPRTAAAIEALVGVAPVLPAPR
jgi:Xaa-Pro aminopeptidase